MTNMLEVALQIVQDLDLPVFPCKEFVDQGKGKISKAPYIPRGFKNATKDIEQIRQWWSKWPHALIGIPTGIETNLFIIDIDNDVEKNGEASFASLGLDDPITCQTLTVSGGRHIIFSYPAQVMLRNTTNNLGQHIDTRGEGGYVIWAGSQTVQGSYRYRDGFSPEETGFQPVPDNILDLLTKNKKASQAMREYAQNPIIGERNNTLFNETVALSNRGVSDERVALHLQQRNHDCAEPLGQKELNGIFNSAISYRASAYLPFTDLGNGERFARDHHDKAMFCRDQKAWYVWSGKVWQQDQTSIEQLAKATTKDMLSEEASTPEMQQQLSKWQKFSESISRQQAMITAASSDEKLVRDISILDNHAHLFNLQNGIYDLTSDTILEHDRKHYQTKIANAALTDTRAPLWLKFIDEITLGDKGLSSYLQKLCGYMLSGDRREQIIIYLIGEGANGKSVFIDVLSHVFGDYAGVISAKALIDRSAGSIPNDVAGLAGKRLVTLSEFPERMHINTTTVKSITGGDKIAARHLYKEWFDYIPAFQLLCAMNELPLLGYYDDAYFRRVRIIPFLRSFKGSEIDKDLTKKLRAEADVILSWCIEGYQLYRFEGLQTPRIVDQQLDEYKRRSDPVAEFVRECITHINDDTFITRDDLVQAVQEYCFSEDMDCPDTNSIKKSLRRLLGDPKQKRLFHNRVRGYSGIKVVELRDDDNPF